MASLARLPEALRDYGVTVSVEWQAGRGGPDDRFVATTGHHTAGRWRNSAGQVLWTPSLGICKRGRADLPGPLCNAFGGRDRVARCITRGWANHPGSGGPLRVGNVTIPRNNGRPYLAGWEFEHDGLTEPLTDEFRDFMARCLAATLDCLGRGPEYHVEHKTWAPGRKSDRRLSLEQARADIARVMGGRGAPAAPPVPRVLRLTSPYTTGADVQALQHDLTRVGFSPGVPDGVYGPATEAAVRAFQARAGLVADGAFGLASRAALATALGAPGTTTLTTEDEDMPTQINGTVPPGETAVVPFGPVLSGAVGWGQGWLVLLSEAAVRVRVLVQGAEGWRPVSNRADQFDLSGRVVDLLRKEDSGVLVENRGDAAVGYSVEYARAI
jgi:hypothetical protein